MTDPNQKPKKKTKKIYISPEILTEKVTDSQGTTGGGGAVCDGTAGGPDVKKTGQMGDGCTTKFS